MYSIVRCSQCNRINNEPTILAQTMHVVSRVSLLTSALFVSIMLSSQSLQCCIHNRMHVQKCRYQLKCLQCSLHSYSMKTYSLPSVKMAELEDLGTQFPCKSTISFSRAAGKVSMGKRRASDLRPTTTSWILKGSEFKPHSQLIN